MKITWVREAAVVERKRGQMLPQVKFLRSYNENNSCFCKSSFTCTSTARCCRVLRLSLESGIAGDTSEQSLWLPFRQNGMCATSTQSISWVIYPQPEFCPQSWAENTIVSVTGKPFSYEKTGQVFPVTTTTLFLIIFQGFLQPLIINAVVFHPSPSLSPSFGHTLVCDGLVAYGTWRGG